MQRGASLAFAHLTVCLHVAQHTSLSAHEMCSTVERPAHGRNNECLHDRVLHALQLEVQLTALSASKSLRSIAAPAAHRCTAAAPWAGCAAGGWPQGCLPGRAEYPGGSVPIPAHTEPPPVAGSAPAVVLTQSVGEEAVMGLRWLAAGGPGETIHWAEARNVSHSEKSGVAQRITSVVQLRRLTRSLTH